MNKEEFLKMLDVELESARKEYELAKNRIRMVTELHASEKEIRMASYQCTYTYKKLEEIEKLIALPALARIQSMSEVEIAEYKNEKIKEIEEKIELLNAELVQKEKRQKKLREERDVIANVYAETEKSRKFSVLDDARKIQDQISDSESKCIDIKSEITTLTDEKDKIISKSSEDIKKELISNDELIKEDKKSPNGYSILKRTQYELEHLDPMSIEVKLLASVGDDPNKASEMIHLLSNYSNLYYSKRAVRDLFDIPYYLSKKVSDKIRTCGSYREDPTTTSTYGKPIGFIYDAEPIIKIIDEHIEEYKEKTKIFKEQFTPEKMNGINTLTDTDNIDFDFLKLHVDKVEEVDINRLKSLLEKKANLSKKIIKTKAIKDEITKLNQMIFSLYDFLITQIRGWYIVKSSEISEVTGIFSYGDILDSSDGVLNHNLDLGMQQLEKLKTRLEYINEKLTKEKTKYDDKLEDLRKIILEQAGHDFKEIDIDVNNISSPYIQDNESKIANSTVRVEEEKIIEDVYKEAQKQADAKEAEIKGITVEQLLKLRKQAEAAKASQQATAVETPVVPNNNPGGLSM